MQYIYTMNGVSKVVPPKREIIKNISLSFFPGAKIGLLGLNGAGKSTVLRIMADVEHFAVNDGVGCATGMKDTFHEADFARLKRGKDEWLRDARTAGGTEAAQRDVG